MDSAIWALYFFLNFPEPYVRIKATSPADGNAVTGGVKFLIVACSDWGGGEGGGRGGRKKGRKRALLVTRYYSCYSLLVLLVIIRVTRYSCYSFYSLLVVVTYLGKNSGDIAHRSRSAAVLISRRRMMMIVVIRVIILSIIFVFFVVTLFIFILLEV